jgi:hypothetical protein
VANIFIATEVLGAFQAVVALMHELGHVHNLSHAGPPGQGTPIEYQANRGPVINRSPRRKRIRRGLSVP